MKDKAKGYIFSVLGNVAFGLQPIFVKLLAKYGVSALTAPLIRAIGMTIMFFALCLVKKEKLWPGIKEMPKLLGLAFSGMALTPTLLFLSYNYIDTGTSTTLCFIYPVFVMLFGVLLYKDKISLKTVLALAICFGGIVLISNPGGNFDLRGLAFALGGGTAYGAYVLFLDKTQVQDKLGVNVYNFWFFLLGGLMLAAFNIVNGTASEIILPLSGWPAAIAFIVDSGIFAAVFFQISVKYLGGIISSILGALEPLTSVIAGALILGEALTVRGVAGCLLVLCGTLLVVNRK